jgi:hypothetical protein
MLKWTYFTKVKKAYQAMIDGLPPMPTTHIRPSQFSSGSTTQTARVDETTHTRGTSYNPLDMPDPSLQQMKTVGIPRENLAIPLVLKVVDAANDLVIGQNNTQACADYRILEGHSMYIGAIPRATPKTSARRQTLQWQRAYGADNTETLAGSIQRLDFQLPYLHVNIPVFLVLRPVRPIVDLKEMIDIEASIFTKIHIPAAGHQIQIYAGDIILIHNKPDMHSPDDQYNACVYAVYCLPGHLDTHTFINFTSNTYIATHNAKAFVQRHKFPHTPPTTSTLSPVYATRLMAGIPAMPI